MICSGNRVPLKEGATVVEFCYEHFELARNDEHQQPAFALHVTALSSDDQLAAFALAPVDASEQAQWFTARWGRTGVGSSNFMPVPSQTEDNRPAIEAYGFRISNFNWRSCQWEIDKIVPAGAYEIPSAQGETVEVPMNQESAYAFRDGMPVADLETLPVGEHVEMGITKETEEGSETYLVRFGGRIWRRLAADSHQPLELLGFDTKSDVFNKSLDGVWGEIGGQEDAKRELVRAIQWPVLYPELFRLFKRQRSRGVLLYGPPGCGKTLLGKAVVRLMAALYHRKADDAGFKYVKGHQLLDQFLGNSEKAVKSLFDEARRWKEQKGYPAVLFFDEADALFKRRPSGSKEQFFTLVPSLLAEMDGMEESGAFVMLATNRPESLDLAITRPGRIDRRIRVTRPDEAASRVIFRIHFDGVFLEDGLTLDDLSAFAASELFAPRLRLYELQFDETPSTSYFLLKDLASGALIQNIADRATANKMEYCIQNDCRSGLNFDDVRVAIGEVLQEQQEAKHDEELEEFAKSQRKTLRSYRAVSESYSAVV